MDPLLGADNDSNLDDIQPLTEPLTLEESAYKELKRVIADGVLRPGDRVSINAIAQRMRVSRLPVIHALRRLASEGFVQMRPHRNAIVTKPTRKEIRVRVLTMIGLEELAVREAWPLSPAALNQLSDIHARSTASVPKGELQEDWDLRFHEVVWRAADVEQLSDMIRTLWDLGAYYRTLMNRRDGVAQARAIEHGAILAAFQGGGVEDAIESIRQHRLKALGRLLDLFAEFSNEAGPNDKANLAQASQDQADSLYSIR